MITPPSPTLLWVLVTLIGALVVGSVARFVGLRKADEGFRKKRLASLRTWWILTIVVGVGLLAGRTGVCLLLTIASLMAFHEYAGLLGIRKIERPAMIAAYAIAVINYLLIALGQISAFVVFVPLAAFGVVAVTQLVQGRAEGYIRTTGGIFWGMMTVFYGLAHSAYLFIHPAFGGGPAGPAGWFLYLVILTEANDIFQAIVGRAMGAHKRRRISPVVSPNKTWEGFFGGLGVTLILAVLLAPWLTSFDTVGGWPGLPGVLQQWIGPLGAGMVVAVAGFFGDINMSGVKRDCGVKDGSKVLPGMGGIIDRIDSLTFTAPAFLYLVGWWITQ